MSLWFNHCPFHCKGCWNEQTWQKDESLERPNQEIIEEALLALDEFGLAKDLTLLGGDPLSLENIQDTLEIVSTIKGLRPLTKVLCWTGYRMDVLLLSKKHQPILPYLDVLIDGRFVEEQKVENYQLFGSSNQRIIDVQQTLAVGKIMETRPELWSQQVVESETLR